MKTASFQNKIRGVREKNWESFPRRNLAERTKSCPLSRVKKNQLWATVQLTLALRSIGKTSGRRNSNKSAVQAMFVRKHFQAFVKISNPIPGSYCVCFVLQGVEFGNMPVLVVLPLWGIKENPLGSTISWKPVTHLSPVFSWRLSLKGLVESCSVCVKAQSQCWCCHSDFPRWRKSRGHLVFGESFIHLSFYWAPTIHQALF